MCVITAAGAATIPPDAIPVSDNKISQVWRVPGGKIWKRSIPYLVENEVAFLSAMQDTGFVPPFTRIDLYTIELQRIRQSPLPIEPEEYRDILQAAVEFLAVLKSRGIRHGDLTPPNILFADRTQTPNVCPIVVLDWAESRWLFDPAPSKRPVPDAVQLQHTLGALIPKQAVALMLGNKAEVDLAELARTAEGRAWYP